MNMICKSSLNGTKCANCEMQLIKDHGVDYVKIRPKTNEDYRHGQILRCVNITPINDIGMRKIDLYNDEYKVLLDEKRQKRYGLCGVNCYQNHNLMSSLSMMPIHFHTMVDDTVYWPSQNYEKDHVANVRGFLCGCGRKWDVNNKGKKEFHNLSDCARHEYTGDVICSNYDKSPMYGLNKIRSYSELAIKSTCRCQPSITLSKHAEAELSRIFQDNSEPHLLKQEFGSCPWRNVNCAEFCTNCLHYWGIQHG